jgi:hypothetical protein
LRQVQSRSSLCPQSTPNRRAAFAAAIRAHGCEPILKTAIELGIATSLEIVTSNDQSEVRAVLPGRPRQSRISTRSRSPAMPRVSNISAFGCRVLMALSPDGSTLA